MTGQKNISRLSYFHEIMDYIDSLATKCHALMCPFCYLIKRMIFLFKVMHGCCVFRPAQHMVSKDKVKLSFEADVSIIMPKTNVQLLVWSELIFWGYEILFLGFLFSVLLFLVHKFALFWTQLQGVGGIDVDACCVFWPANASVIKSLHT